MVDNPEVIANEDLEYIVQAEKAYGGPTPSINVTDESKLDVVDGQRSNSVLSSEDEEFVRNVRFNENDDVCMIDRFIFIIKSILILSITMLH